MQDIGIGKQNVIGLAFRDCLPHRRDLAGPSLRQFGRRDNFQVIGLAKIVGDFLREGGGAVTAVIVHQKIRHGPR